MLNVIYEDKDKIIVNKPAGSFRRVPEALIWIW